MHLLKLEGDLDGIGDIQIKYIRDVLNKHGYTDNEVIIERVGQAGDNFIANVKRITVKVKDGNDFKMIAKIAPKIEQLRAAVNSQILFSNEVMMYSVVLPKLVSLQETAGVPTHERLKYAKLYGYLDEVPNEIILLEDLRESNFTMLDRLKSLSNDAVKLILKNFALLHSLSYVLKKQEQNIYEKYKNSLIDMWAVLNQTDDFKRYMAHFETGALEILDREKYKRAVRGSFEQSSVCAKKISKYESHSKFLVIQQGDAWTNNVLFKLKDGKATECIMIDYQLSKEANPVCDILYMIFNCTDYQSRTQYFDEWIDHYHNELDQSLANFGMKANFVYPKDQLDADLKRYAKVFFGLAIMQFNLLTRKPDEAPDMQEAFKNIDNETNWKIVEEQASVATLGSNTTLMYKTKVEELIDSCRELGFI